MKIKIALLTLGMLAASAQAGTVAAEERPAGQAQADVKAVAEAGNAFACDLYGQLRQKPGNLFCSPASIHSALAMTYAGAAGRTGEQMAGTLHFKLPPARLHAAFGRLTHQLNHPLPNRRPAVGRWTPPYQLVVSNALWLQQGFPFRRPFKSLVKTHYGAGLNEVDYNRPEAARQTINGWVEKATARKIKDLIGPRVLNAATRLVLTNAIYFKSDWSSPFKKHATRTGPFKLPGGNSVNVKLMRQTMHVGYMETDAFQLADLAYKRGVLSMTVLLPRKADGLAALEKQLSAKALAGWLGKAKATRVNLTLPRFKFTSRFRLKDPLVKLGMTDAFDSRKADFSGMTTAERLFIAAVIHKAFVDVDEEGTEAAAATAVMMEGLAMPRPPKVTFRADRPFLFLIRHRPTGAVLFLGRLANPKS